MVADMGHKSRIKAQANVEIDDLRRRIIQLPYGGLISLGRRTGIERTTLSRFKNGNVVSSEKYKMIEVAMREVA
ncbi:MAG: hypothetical protein HRT37_00975 [Alteromonadaceae bacterium]|nr:hypothetical protein [Alteromonadaceae bacterium]